MANVRKGRQPAGTAQPRSPREELPVIEVAEDFNNGSNDNRRKPAVYEALTQTIQQKQQEQIDMINAHDVTFCIGPAGTGKTHIAIFEAVNALKDRSDPCKSILLCRPAVEAGATIGFLPGSQNEKMAPYMRPLYDALKKAYPKQNIKEMIVDDANPERPVEVAPVGTMRGRTFENTFVIIDEAQNLKWEELKMVLTRLGPGSKIVITGDPDQVDLDPPSDSGLMKIIAKLGNTEGVAIHQYGPQHIMRHKTVKNILADLEEPEVKAPKNQHVTGTPTP